MRQGDFFDSCSATTTMTNEIQGSSKNEMIKLEKDSSNYADYHGLERPGDVANTGSMKYAQLANFFDNISAENNVAMRYLKLVKLFDVRLRLFI